MNFIALFLLVSRLVEAAPNSFRSQCIFKVSVDDISPQLVPGESKTLFGGELWQVSAKAINRIIHEPGFRKRVQTECGPKPQLTLISNCLVPSGWTFVNMTTSVPKASMMFNEFLIKTASGHDWKPGMVSTFRLDYPQDPDSWFINISFSTYSESTSGAESTSSTKIFPKVEPFMHRNDLEDLRYLLLRSFPTKYTCLMELNKHISWSKSMVYRDDLFRMRAKSPITPATVWKMTNNDAENSKKGPARAAQYDVTRYYAKDGPRRSIKLEPFEDNSLFHHFGFFFTL